MMIAGISSYGRIANIYAYSNTHYNQIHNSAVSPVNGVPGIAKLDEKQDEQKFAVTYSSGKGNDVTDAVAAGKEQASLVESYKEQNVVTYNQSNPYERARMSIENSLLSGMNFDMLA